MLPLGIRLDEVVSEVRYCSWAGFSWHHDRGLCANRQDEALRLGWLMPSPTDPRRLKITPSGRAEIDRRQERG